MTPTEQPYRKPSRETTTTLVVTLADTTWRMVTPSALGVAAGIYLDLQLGTKPWMTLAGVALGLLASAGLIRHQLSNIK